MPLLLHHLTGRDQIVQAYRFATQDEFTHELSEWDLPIWFVTTKPGFIRVITSPYAELDDNPLRPILPHSVAVTTVISPEQLQEALSQEPGPGETELMDALNSFARGDLTESVRRVLTAIEVVTESALRRELGRKWAPHEVDRKLAASENDFPGRLRQFEKLDGRKLGSRLWAELDNMRKLRHDIVHRGRRFVFADRDEVHRLLETGLTIFEWIEADEQKQTVRANRLDMRSLRRERGPFVAEITGRGVRVRRKAL